MARTVAERIEVMKSLRDQMEDRLLEMTTRPRPTYTVDGQNFNHTEYQKFLTGAIADLSDLIVALEDTADDAGGLTMTQVFTG